MNNLPLSLDDDLASKLIAHLRADDTLTDMVLPDVYDQDDQSSDIVLSAQSFGVAIAVSIQAPEPNADDRTRRAGRMNLPLMVSVIAAPNMAMPAPHATVMSCIRSIQARLISRIKGWQYNNCPENTPVVTGIYDLDLTQMDNLSALIGRTIVLSCPVNY